MDVTTYEIRRETADERDDRHARIVRAQRANVTVTGRLITWIEHGQPREIYATSAKAAERIARRITKRLAHKGD